MKLAVKFLKLNLVFGVAALSMSGLAQELTPEIGVEEVEAITSKVSEKEVMYLERGDEGLVLRSSGAMWFMKVKNYAVEKLGGEITDQGLQVFPFAGTDSIDVEKSFLARGYTELGMMPEDYLKIDDSIDAFSFLELREISVDSTNSKLLAVLSSSSESSAGTSELVLPFKFGGVLATPIYARLVYQSTALTDWGKQTLNLKGTLYQSLDGEIAYVDFEKFSDSDAGGLGCGGRYMEQAGRFCLSWLTKSQIAKVIDEALERVLYLHFEQTASERAKLATAVGLASKRLEYERLSGQRDEGSDRSGFFKQLFENALEKGKSALEAAKAAGNSVEDNVKHSSELKQAEKAMNKALDNVENSEELEKAKEALDGAKDQLKKLF